MKMRLLPNILVGIIVICVLCVLPGKAAFARHKSTLPQINSAELTNEYQRLTEEYAQLLKQTDKRLLKKIKRKRGGQNTSFTKEQVALKIKYDQLNTRLQEITPVYELKEALKINYLNYYELPQNKLTALDQEASMLAVNLFAEIARLKTQYKSFFIPTVHNLMIGLKIKKRGACKDWAEDLLTYMRPIERHYFTVTWLEANPKKVNEHNVATIIPGTQPVSTGLIIDPWRTSGKPFWIKVTDDHHYHWQVWQGYGMY